MHLQLLHILECLAPSYFKNNPDFEVYYTDTDSFFIKGKLPENMVGPNLGQFKLENSFKEIVFLGPKIYSGITIENKTITKIKGFKIAKELNFEQIKSLLLENSNLNLNHVKWFRSIDKIEMKESPYLLSNTENKRTLIYKNNGASC